MHKDTTLRAMAGKVSEHAHCPQSKRLVGAVVESSDGRVFMGAKVENRTPVLTMCAVRVAIFAAVSDGVRHIVQVAISSSAGCKGKSDAVPCTACRLVMEEFMGDETLVHIEGASPITLKQMLEQPSRPSKNA